MQNEIILLLCVCQKWNTLTLNCVTGNSVAGNFVAGNFAARKFRHVIILPHGNFTEWKLRHADILPCYILAVSLKFHHASRYFK